MSDKLSDLIETSCIIQKHSIVFTLGSNRFVKSKKRKREREGEREVGYYSIIDRLFQQVLKVLFLDYKIFCLIYD